MSLKNSDSIANILRLRSLGELLERLLDLGHAVREFVFKGCGFVPAHLFLFLKLLFVAFDLFNQGSLFMLKLVLLAPAFFTSN